MSDVVFRMLEHFLGVDRWFDRRVGAAWFIICRDGQEEEQWGFALRDVDVFG